MPNLNLFENCFLREKKSHITQKHAGMTFLKANNVMNEKYVRNACTYSKLTLSLTHWFLPIAMNKDS